MPTQKDQSQSVISAEKSRDLVKTAQYTSHCQPQMMLTQLAYLMEKIKKKKKKRQHSDNTRTSSTCLPLVCLDPQTNSVRCFLCCLDVPVCLYDTKSLISK